MSLFTLKFLFHLSGQVGCQVSGITWPLFCWLPYDFTLSSFKIKCYLCVHISGSLNFFYYPLLHVVLDKMGYTCIYTILRQWKVMFETTAQFWIPKQPLTDCVVIYQDMVALCLTFLNGEMETLTVISENNLYTLKNFPTCD